MKRAIRLLLTILPLLLLALFAGSNRELVTLSLWPTDFSMTLPLSLAVLGAAGLAFPCGGLLVWIGTIRQRRQLRRTEEAVRLLEDQIRALNARLAPPTSPNQALPPPAA
jgi:lipopolysaccharide assembly protein A